MFDIITKTAYELGWLQQSTKSAADNLKSAHRLKNWDQVLLIAAALEALKDEASAKAAAFAKEFGKEKPKPQPLRIVTPL